MKKLENYALLFLLVFVIVRGFSSAYETILWLSGLPTEWWTGLITSALGGLSAWGLFKWIEKVGEEDK